MSNPEIDLNQASQNNSGQRPQTQRRPLSRSLFLGLGVAALLLGVVIYSGIHQRAMAASNLGAATERAAIATVDVIEPKSGATLQELVPMVIDVFLGDTVDRKRDCISQWMTRAAVHQGNFLPFQLDGCYQKGTFRTRCARRIPGEPDYL